MTSKKILQKLKALGYTVRPGIYSDHLTLYPVRSRDSAAKFRYDITDLPHCCGIEEIGNTFLSFADYNSDNDSEIKVRASHPKYSYVILYIQYLFLKEKEGKTTPKTRTPLIFNGNGLDASCFCEVALNGLPHDFKLVSQSINPQSRNKISTYISK